MNEMMDDDGSDVSYEDDDSREYEEYEEFDRGFVRRRFGSQNLVTRLICREMYGGSLYNGCPRDFGGKPISTTRGFFLDISPNYTLVNVEKPPCFLRKFTPDGKYFIAFSPCQTHLEVYLFLGPGAAGEMVHNCQNHSQFPHDHLGNDDHPAYNKLRNNVFKTFFRLTSNVALALNGEQLNRECSLFSECGKKVIVGSAAYLPEDPHPLFEEICNNNESVSPNPRNPLENYTLYSVDVRKGVLIDKIEFKTDKIFLSHNQGIYLYDQVLAILSVQHQTVHVYRYSKHGEFLPMLKIGRLLYDDDEFLLSRTGMSGGQQISQLPGRLRYSNYREKTINQLKHRLLVYLYERAVRISKMEENIYELRNFYQFFDQVNSLRIWKMQLLDEKHILLKYASEDVVTLRSNEPNMQYCLFVVYNMSTTEIVTVTDNSSDEFMKVFENYCDFFRNTNSWNEGQGYTVVSSPSNDIHACLMQHRFKQTVICAKNGGVTEARKRVLAQLPISSQSFSTSPYLDMSLFSYDEKWISVMERPKACGENAIQFYDRESGKLKFKIYAGIMGRQPPPAARRLVAYIFHPTDPFAISVQRTNLEYVVNFHVRKTPLT